MLPDVVREERQGDVDPDQVRPDDGEVDRFESGRREKGDSE